MSLSFPSFPNYLHLALIYYTAFFSPLLQSSLLFLSCDLISSPNALSLLLTHFLLSSFLWTRSVLHLLHLPHLSLSQILDVIHSFLTGFLLLPQSPLDFLMLLSRDFFLVYHSIIFLLLTTHTPYFHCLFLPSLSFFCPYLSFRPSLSFSLSLSLSLS